ncbi:zwei Ig domain protein zig-8-like [Mytilus californianus]|uniref:zwei Ig domain protein zig-8-like n=1 Tax=Mytilus californianus TaxID=6549 RepID=UPI002245557A|nr:zwei Ig domain protein zig-8-like [Mytilus californianus]
MKFRFNDVGLWIIWRSFHDALLIHLLFCCVWSVTSMATLKPVFNKTPVNVTFYRGETATLPCSVSNLGSSSVVWKRIDEPHVLTVGEFAFVSDPKFSVKHIPFRDEWNLIIDHVEPQHSGRYECQISTKDDIVRYVDLNVINEPGHDSKHVNIDGPHLVEKGHPIRLTCNASGNSRSPTDIKWYIGGKRLYNELNHNVRIITYPRSDVNTLYSELRITKSDTEDSGTYVCQTTFYNDILKVAKHNLSVIIADSNQTKRGTMADGSVNSVKDNKRPSSRNTGNASRRIEIAFMPYLFTFLVAWCFAQ